MSASEVGAAPTATVPRRVVTGHDARGVSVVISDGIVPVHRFMPQDGVGFYEIWQTDDAPAAIPPVEPNEPTERTLRVPPEPRGTKIRINEFFPGHIGPEGRQSPIHRTESVDYGIVLEGEIVLILDDTEVTLIMHGPTAPTRSAESLSFSSGDSSAQSSSPSSPPTRATLS
jgi:hypothetical protein